MINNITVVVVGAMWDHRGKFFVAERNYGDLAGCWEFPGGKVEANESDSEALVREWQEELEIDCKVEELLWEEVITLEDTEPFVVKTYRVSVEGKINPVLSVHKQSKWMNPNALRCVHRVPSLHPDWLSKLT